VGVIATGQNAVLGSILIAENKTKVSSYATIFGGIVSILFNLALIPYYGIYAAAFATGVAYISMNLVIIKGLSLKVSFIRYDFFAICYYIVLSGTIIYFLNNSNMTMEIIKFCILLLSIFIIPRFYKVDLSTINNLFATLMLKFKRSNG
jgi:O-antigen/teichoic acid export membrane protein